MENTGRAIDISNWNRFLKDLKGNGYEIRKLSDNKKHLFNPEKKDMGVIDPYKLRVIIPESIDTSFLELVNKYEFK